MLAEKASPIARSGVAQAELTQDEA